MSRPVPSPSMYGMMGRSGTTSVPRASSEIRAPSLGTVGVQSLAMVARELAHRRGPREPRGAASRAVLAPRARSDGDAELDELLLRHLRRCIHEQILAPLRLREGDHVPNVVGTGEDHGEPVEPEGEAAVGRRAGFE